MISSASLAGCKAKLSFKNKSKLIFSGKQKQSLPQQSLTEAYLKISLYYWQNQMTLEWRVMTGRSQESGSMPNVSVCFLRPNYRHYKGFSWQTSWGKAPWLMADLVHSQCFLIFWRGLQLGLRTSRPVMLIHISAFLAQMPPLRGLLIGVLNKTLLFTLTYFFSTSSRLLSPSPGVLSQPIKWQ